MARKAPYNVKLAASLSRTAAPTLTPVSFQDPDAVGVIVHVDVTNAGTGSITAFIEGYDIAADKWYTVLAGAAITTVSQNTYWVVPGMQDATNSQAGRRLPHIWRVRIAHNNANAITYSVGCEVLTSE